VRSALGRAAEAEPLFEQAADMVERVFGPDHPHAKLCRANLALCRAKLGKK